MAIPKFFANVAGLMTEVLAGLQVGGTPDTVVVTRADGLIDETFFPASMANDAVVSMTASGALFDGALVNIFDAGSGVFKVRLADATTAGKEAHGFVQAAYTDGDTNVKVYFENNNSHLSGLVPGKRYLSTTAGLTQATPPTGSGNIVQVVGFATSATNMNFQSQSYFVLA